MFAMKHDLLCLGTFVDVPRFTLYLIWMLKGHMIPTEDKLPFQMQNYSFFHLDMLGFLFFLLFVVTAWEMFYHVKQIISREIIWKYIEATLQVGMVCCLLWGLGRIIGHDFNNRILWDEYQIYFMLPFSPFLPSTPAPLSTKVFKKPFLEFLPKLLHGRLTCLKESLPPQDVQSHAVSHVHFKYLSHEGRPWQGLWWRDETWWYPEQVKFELLLGY